jgi:hypothetical protein
MKKDVTRWTDDSSESIVLNPELTKAEKEKSDQLDAIIKRQKEQAEGKIPPPNWKRGNA